MVYRVLLDADYTFDASEKTITLLGDYATLELPQLISIKNATKGLLTMYDCNNPNTAISYTAPTISWDPVFSYKGTAFADGDDLQIIICPTSTIVAGIDGGTP